MTEKTTDATYSVLDDMDDLELITRMLNGQLDPERVDAVRRRLAEDAEFRDLAAPLLLTWTVPPHIERNPRPDGEWERDWSEFTKRTGFGGARPGTPAAPTTPQRPRWRSLGKFLFFVLLAYVYVQATALRSPRSSESDTVYSPVPHDTGWIALNDGIEVRLEPGASLEAAHRNPDSRRRFRLDGAARFRIGAIHTPEWMLRTEAVIIETAAGLVNAGESDFNVSTRADTTLVQVHPLGPRRALQPLLTTVSVTARFGNEAYHLPLQDLDGARLVKGHDPQLIRPTR